MSFLGDSIDTDIEITCERWADFDLDDKPRIILLAGSFGIEITAPVTWLIEEYGMEIACIPIEAYKHNGRVLLNSQQVIPVPEAEAMSCSDRGDGDANTAGIGVSQVSIEKRAIS